ncbi:UDP-N-acetylmuramoyl-L-alanine--D-glutamate ligase [soil metagenome]
MSGLFAGERAVVVGFGASGRAASSVLAGEGARVRVSEAKTASGLRAGGERAEDALPNEPLERIEILTGGHRAEHLDGATLVVTSPGVPESAPILMEARRRRLPIWSELEVGARLCRVPVVAVTGTNGKTTTVELIAEMMRSSGLRARACGNVGYPFSVAATETFDALAVEASSFQLRFTTTLAPRVSVLLNLAPDHLDWHGSYRSYAAAKARIFANQRGDDVHVGNADDTQAARVSATAPCRRRWFSSGPPDAGQVGIVDGSIVARVDGEHHLGVPAVAGRGFLSDAAAAAAAALAFGTPPQAVSSALSTARPLPHRGMVVARIGRVRFVDDSKATNPHAALAAMDGMTAVVLIAGGLSKGVDLSPLAAAAPSLAGVVGIGEAAPKLMTLFEGLVPVETAASMPDAVRRAFRMAPADGTILLAPACASQDMFRDYRQRGECFADAALAIVRGAGSAAGTDDRRRLHA